MELKSLNLHHKKVQEALDSVRECIAWIIKNGKVGCVIIHGKGSHGNKAVVKQEVRKMLENNHELMENDYLVIKGEDSFPITESLDDGVVVVIRSGYENESYGSGGQKQQEKKEIVYEEDGRLLRKNAKKNRKKSRKKICYQERLYNEHTSNRCYSTMSKKTSNGRLRISFNKKKTTDNIVWNSEHLDSIDIESIWNNIPQQNAVLCEIFDISDQVLYIKLIKKDIDKVGQLPCKIIEQLNQIVRNLTLFNSDIPVQMYIKSTNYGLLSEFSHCKIGDVVLICKPNLSSSDVVNPLNFGIIIVFEASSFQIRPMKKIIENDSYVRNILTDMTSSKEESENIRPKIIGRLNLESLPYRKI